jgi:hypothetical protein
LFAFNVGVELGQLLVILLLVPLLRMLFRFVPERIGTIVLSALVAHTAWHWMIERGETLSRFPRPAIDAAFLMGTMRWLMAVLVLTGAVWLLNGALRRRGWLAANGTPPREGP